MFVADPKLAGFDSVELGQYFYKDRTEFHRCHSHELVCCDNAWRLESELMEKRSGFRNILLCAAAPLHYGE